MKKRILATLLTVALLCQLIQTAALATSLTDEELHVSDAFAAAYPNGYFDLDSAAIQTQEYSGRVEAEVIRSGGTEGRVVVTLKAIDVTTTEDDYILDVPEALTEDEADLTESPMPAPALSVTSHSTGLRAVREAATGTTSDRAQYTAEKKSEMVETAREAAEDYYASASGTKFTLVFEPGERAKSFGIEIINDEEPETEEQLILVMTRVSGGGALGDQRETVVNIEDDEAAETPMLCFSAEGYTANGDTAEVTLVRSAGLNYYAGGTVRTLDGSAAAGTDYTAVEKRFLFVPGQETVTVSVPVAENNGADAIGFTVQVISDGSCTISGRDTAQVTIPPQLQLEKFAPALSSRARSAITASETPVTLGVASIKYTGTSAGSDGVEANFSKVGTAGASYFRTTYAGWYEVKITHDNMKSGLKLKRTLYKNLLSSITADMTLFECGHENHFDVNVWTGFEQGNATHYSNLIAGRDGYDDRHENITVSSGDTTGYGLVNKTAPFTLSLYIQNGKKDYGAIRLYSLTLNFMHYALETAAFQDTVYHFDFATGTATAETVTPGTIEIRDSEGRLVSDFYTSENSTALTVSTKDVLPGYYLKELRLYNNRDSDVADYKTIEMGKNGGTLVIDSAFLSKYGGYTVSGSTFLIQPVFVRDEASLTVNISGADREKGGVSGVIFSNATGDAARIYTKNNNPNEDLQITLHVGDTVNLVGVGSEGNAVTGFEVSKGDGAATGKKTEVVGAENAGTVSFMLDKTNEATPIFGERTFTVSPDPDLDAGVSGSFSMGIAGETEGGVTFTNSGELTGVKSGKEADVLVVPPWGYTTQWANRSGDTNGNGVLDDEEIRDADGNLYLRYDYNGDGELDAEYKNTLYGDLFRTRINQPQTQYYYSFVPLSGQLLYTGQVTGYLKTYEYDVYHGYSTAVDRNGLTIKKLVPVSDASVVMGGSYNAGTEGAETSYATATDFKGKFTFNVTNVLKNAPYFLSIRNGAASFYTDYMTPSLSGSNYVIPLFASMRPVKVSAASADKATVSGSVITLNKDSKVTFSLEVASLESNVAVDRVKFNVHSEDGTQRSTTPINVAYGTAQYSVAADKAFEAGDTLKVVLVDQNGNETIEYDTGYEFRPSIKSPVGLPSFASPVESVVLPLFQSVAGGLNLGSVSTEVPADGDTYTIRLGNEHAFEGSERILHQTEESGADSDEVQSKIAEKNSGADTKKDTNVKTKTSVSSKMSAKVSLELIIKYDSTAKNYYFGSLQLMVTLDDESALHHETTVTLPVGLTVVATLDIGGQVSGFLKITPVKQVGATDALKNYMDEYGNFEYTDSNMFKDDDYRFYFEGGLILKPKISLSVKGSYSIGTVEVNGSAQFRMVFTTSNSNSGTVTLKAGVSVKTLGIEVYSKNFGSVEYNLFGRSYGLTLTDADAAEEVDSFAPVAVSDEHGDWQGKDLPPQDPGPGAYGFTEATLLSGVYPDPDTQTMQIDDDSLLMVFLDVVEDRDAYNKAALYYSVSNNNGTSYSEPLLLNDDGTTDSMPCLIDLGDSIACLYSNVGTTVSASTKMEELLEQTELEMRLYDKMAGTWSEVIEVTRYTAVEGVDGMLTGDYFTNSHAAAAYDAAAGKLLILYMKSDYTSDNDKTFRAVDLFDTSEDGYYSTVACRIYDTGSGEFLSYGELGYPAGDHVYWDEYFYGQMFPDTSVSGIDDPLVLDITAAYHNGKAYLVYTVDVDNDLETAKDRDVYLMTYSFEDNSFTTAVKVSDIYPGDTNEGKATTANENPQFTAYDGRLYLFYTSDSSVCYVDPDLLLAHTPSDWDEPDGDGTTSKTHTDLLPITAGIALDGTDKDNAPGDYQVLKGDDGRLYFVWTESTLRYASEVQPGTPESLEDGNSFNESQVYASVYYGYEDVTDVNVPAGYGAWSDKVQLTAGPGKYSDVSAAVMSDGHILLAAKKEHLDGSQPPEMVAMTLLPAVRAEMEENISFGEDYPIAGETTSLTASFQNLSLMALSDVSVEFFAVQNGTETAIGTAELEQSVCGGETAMASIDFTVPENPEGLSIRARLSAYDPNTEAVTVLTEKDTAFPYAVELNFNTLRMTHVAQDYYSLYAEVLHTGNKPFTEGDLVLSLVDSDDGLTEIQRVSLSGGVLGKELFTVNKTFTLSNDDLKEVSGVIGGSADLDARIVSGGETLVSHQDTVTKDLSDSYGGILAAVSAVSLPDDLISLPQGGTFVLSPSVTTASNESAYTLTYRSSNTSIAAVSDSGVVRAHAPGSATITAYAVPDVATRLLSENSYGTDKSLLEELSLEDLCCDSAVVTVSSGNGDDTSDSTTTPKTTDTARVTTATLQKQAHGEQALVLSANGVKVTFDVEAVRGILAQTNEDVILSVTRLDSAELSAEVQSAVGSRPVFEITLKGDGNTVSQLGGETEVSIPYTPSVDEELSAIVVWYIDGDGNLSCMTNGRYDPEPGAVTFTTTHFSSFAVGYNAVIFADVTDADWYYDAVTYLAAREITTGTTATMFSPDMPLTRGQFVTLLLRAYGIEDDGNPSDNFSDAGNTYYTGYLAAAKRLGISSGVGDNMFAPEQTITRQEMFTLLYNALNKLDKLPDGDSGKTLSDFSGSGDIASWAQEAMAYLVQSGVVSGDGGTLDPTDGSTRAQMAQVLYNLLRK